MKKHLFFTVISLFMLVSAPAQGNWSTLHLSQKRIQMGSAASGSKVYFAGGIIGEFITPKVEIYDISSGVWTTAQLSAARSYPAGVAVGNKVLFAGGYALNVSAVVDIFDTLSQNWTTATLSKPRFSIAAVSYGTKALFAGGVKTGINPKVFSTVDIYDADSGTWSLDSLSEARAAMGFGILGSKAFFAGGYKLNSQVTDRVDIYDFTTEQWSTAQLSQARAVLQAAVSGNKILFAGGQLATGTPSDRVDIFDATTGLWTTAALSPPRGLLEQGGVSACGKAFFVGGCYLNYQTDQEYNPFDVVDIYDAATNEWSVEHLSGVVLNNAVVANGNRVFSAGGTSNLMDPAQDKSTVEVYTCATSSINGDWLENSLWTAFPNPATDVIFIQTTGENTSSNARLRLIDAMGKVVFEKTGVSNFETVRTAGFAPGVYFLEMTDGGQKIFDKIWVVK